MDGYAAHAKGHQRGVGQARRRDGVQDQNKGGGFACPPVKRRTVKATTILALALALACAAADYPEAQISNGVLQVKLLLPDAQNGYYRGTRFDWSGAISSLQFQGHEYFGNWVSP